MLLQLQRRYARALWPFRRSMCTLTSFPGQDEYSGGEEEIVEILEDEEHRFQGREHVESGEDEEEEERRDAAPFCSSADDRHSRSNVFDKSVLEYRIKKQRIHARLWRDEIAYKDNFDQDVQGSSSIQDVDVHNTVGTIWNQDNGQFSSPYKLSDIETGPEGWEKGNRFDRRTLEEEAIKEREILAEEFKRRIEFNKKQITAFVKNHLLNRRRPSDGWAHMVEELGLEGKRERVSEKSSNSDDF